MTIQEQIKQRIDGAIPGTVFFVNDFAEFDNEYVSKILSIKGLWGTWTSCERYIL